MLRKLGRPWGREGERQRGREQHSQATLHVFFKRQMIDQSVHAAGFQHNLSATLRLVQP